MALIRDHSRARRVASSRGLLAQITGSGVVIVVSGVAAVGGAATASPSIPALWSSQLRRRCRPPVSGRMCPVLRWLG